MVTYEKEFKEQAIKMATEIGSAKAAKDLGISVNTLYTWISRSKKHKEHTRVGGITKGHGVVGDEIAMLKKRNKELERANEILKEALGFFAVSQKK